MMGFFTWSTFYTPRTRFFGETEETRNSPTAMVLVQRRFRLLDGFQLFGVDNILAQILSFINKTIQVAVHK